MNEHHDLREMSSRQGEKKKKKVVVGQGWCDMTLDSLKS